MVSPGSPGNWPVPIGDSQYRIRSSDTSTRPSVAVIAAAMIHSLRETEFPEEFLGRIIGVIDDSQRIAAFVLVCACVICNHLDHSTFGIASQCGNLRRVSEGTHLMKQLITIVDNLSGFSYMDEEDVDGQSSVAVRVAVRIRAVSFMRMTTLTGRVASQLVRGGPSVCG